MAKGYCVVTFRSVREPAKVEAYRKIAAPAIQAAGGVFLVGGMPTKVYEVGRMERVAIIEFESVEKAIALHDGPEYQSALRALGDGAERDLRIVQGL